MRDGFAIRGNVLGLITATDHMGWVVRISTCRQNSVACGNLWTCLRFLDLVPAAILKTERVTHSRFYRLWHRPCSVSCADFLEAICGGITIFRRAIRKAQQET
jgi:hypothetical protein